MPLLKRGAIAPPIAPEEVLDVPELGGEVLIRGMSTAERLDLASIDLTGQSEFARMYHMTAMVVLDAERKPIFSADQWEAFSRSHNRTYLTIVEKGQVLSGLRTADAKKTEHS